MTHCIRHNVKIPWSALCTKSKTGKLSVFRQMPMCSWFTILGGVTHLKMYHGLSPDWKIMPLLVHHSYFTKPATMLQKTQLAQGQFVNIFPSGKHSNLKMVLYALFLRYCWLWLEVFMLPYDNFQACLRDFSPDPHHTEVLPTQYLTHTV